MVKELMHIFRTYFITFRYINKKELTFFWMTVYAYILYFLFTFFILNLI